MVNKNMVGLFYLLAFLLLAGCSSNPVDFVKNGTLKIDKSVTVGDVFDGYKHFTKKEWKYLETPQKRKVVEFNGTVNFNHFRNYRMEHGQTPDDFLKRFGGLSEVIYTSQFSISKDGKSFEMTYSGLEGIYKDGSKKERKEDGIILSIFANNDVLLGICTDMLFSDN